jgi:hypothetical protein
MTPDERFISHQRIHDLAVARARELRAQAIRSFWSALALALTQRVHRWGRLPRDGRRTQEVA